MPKLKTDTVMIGTGGLGTFSLKFEIHVNVSGEFYSPVPLDVEEYFTDGRHYRDSVICRANKKGRLTLYTKAMECIGGVYQDALSAIHKPDIQVEHVIKFNIESKVSFATDDEGNIYPNASKEGTHWMGGDEKGKYGGLHATNCNAGGYSLTIGAKALTKTTITLGQKKKVTYKNYYEDGNHFSYDNPAGKLNSWSHAFSLKEDAREIPYSGEAAMFFYDLMMGMAKLSKLIQDNTFDTAVLLANIDNGLNLLPKAKAKIGD